MNSRLLSSGLLFCLLACACTTPQTETTDLGADELSSFCTDTATESPHLPAGDVLSLVQSEDGDPKAYEFAVNHDAEIIPVDDNKSYAVWWEPEEFDLETGTVIVSLGGHGGWAVKDFEVWYPQLSERNMAYLSLQWWFGRSLENEGYYEPDQIYKWIEEQLEDKGVTPGNVIFQGFSMGSARSYGVSLYDKSCGSSYFGVNIANAGPWEDNYPLYAEILTENYGEKPFEGTKWILFCGEKDENEYSQTGVTHVCTGMEHTEQTLKDLGGTIELFIQDPTGDHGSFMINDENVEEALSKAEETLVQD